VADGSHAFGVFVREDELGSAGHEPPASDKAPRVAKRGRRIVGDRPQPTAANAFPQVSPTMPITATNSR
jgi:hypothetical protein